MTLTIVASGSRGDVQPYIALGTGLKSAGYQVRILTSDDFAGLVTEAGLDFRSTGLSVESVLQNPEWRKTTESGNFLKIMAKMNREMGNYAHEMAAKTPALLEDSDLIIAGVGGFGGVFAIAEKLNIPTIQAYVFPLTPTRTFSSPLTPNLPFGGVLNPLSFQIMRQMLWQTGRMVDVTVRRDLGMPKGSFFGPYGNLKRRRIPVMYGYSQHVLPRPTDWDDLTQITGYWFLDTPDGWTPPSELVEFLKAGAPPVYIGFGSMGNRNPEEVAALTLKALQLSGQRGVLAAGWGGLKPADLPQNVYMLTSIPHSWLFPQMAAVVHHGGAGTTAAGLRAGVPSIIIPFFGDQPFWGKRVAQLGVGTPPIPRRQLTAENLATAIQQAVTDKTMQRQAAALGAKIRAEDGIGQAVTLIQQIRAVTP